MTELFAEMNKAFHIKYVDQGPQHFLNADHWWAEHFALAYMDKSIEGTLAIRELAQRATITLNGEDRCNPNLEYHAYPHKDCKDQWQLDF